jgi:GNAT superfamily N-acetyltransferase
MTINTDQIPEGYTISDDPSLLDMDVLYNYIGKESYWSTGMPREVLEKSVTNSLCFGVYFQGAQIGFARMITDKATFAYLADVFILEPHRGKGLSKRLMEFILAHPDLQGLRRMMLTTRDAHGLYTFYGFTPLRKPQNIMERHNPDVYKTGQ